MNELINDVPEKLILLRLIRFYGGKLGLLGLSFI